MRLLEDAGKNGWTVADFSVMMVAVDLSDESHFQLCSDNHRRRAWRRLGQRADPAFTIARHTSHQQQVMVWGAISFDSPTSLDVIRSTLTAQRNVVDILRTALICSFCSSLALSSAR
ncbi:transposable element Tc1 transposase [Trichonephila clavipes]|nr:transposable element Tc1 transposase [Trichonephila clavipes]